MKQFLDNYSISGRAITLTGINLPQNHILLITDVSNGGILYSLKSGNGTYIQGTNSVLTLSGTGTIGPVLAITYDDGVTSTNGPTGVSLTAGVSLAGGQTLTAALANGSTLSSSISNFPAVQNVSLVGDSLTAIPASLTAGVSLASGQSVGISSLPAISGTVTAGRNWTLATSTDSLTAAISSLPAVSLVNGQTLTAALANGSTLAGLGSVSSLPAVNLANGQTLTSALANGQTLTAALANGSTLTSSINNFPSLQAVSGTITAGRTWNLATSTDSLTAAISSLPAVSLATGQNVGISSLPAVSFANGSTLSSSISNFPAVQNVSLVGDSLTAIPASLTAGVSLAGNQTLTAGRNWNLTAATDSLTATISSLPAISLASNQTVTSALANGSTLTAALANGSTLTAALANGSTLSNIGSISTLPAITGTVTANTGLSQPLTDTQLRATAVPVSLASVPSHPVTNAGTFPTQITNGSNTLGIDSLGAITANTTPLGIVQAYSLPSGTAGSSYIIGSANSGVDVSAFRSAAVQITACPSGASIAYHVSNDPTFATYTPQQIIYTNAGSAGSHSTVSCGYVGLGFKYFRAAINGTFTGTLNLLACYSTTNIPNTSFAFYLNNIGNTASGTAATTSQIGLVVAHSPNSPLPAGSNTIGNVNAYRYNSNAALTTAGGSVSTLAGGATVLGGSSATKSLTVQNNNTAGNIYFSVGANSTATLPQAQCALLTPGQGFTFDVLPSSTQYLFLQSPTSGLTYSRLYA